MTVMAVVSSGTAYADTVLPGNNGSYQVSASSAGLYLALAGTKLTGGTASASGTYNFAAGANSPTETASATGQGFLLSTQLTGNPASAGVDSSKGAPYTASDASGSAGDPVGNGGSGGGNGDVGGPSYPNDCAQGGGQVQSGVGLFVGLGCGYAHAAVDAPSTTPAGPQALGVGDIATASVSLQGILNQLYGSGLNQLCTGLSQIPTLGSQILAPACTQILNSANPSLTVNLGNAYSEVVSSAQMVESVAHSSSVDVSVFPGLDNGNEPLLRVEIPSATAVSCEGTGCTPPSTACSTTGSGSSSGWTNWFDSGLIVITGTLLDSLHTVSSSFPDPLEIPSCGQTSSGVSQLDNSPLSQLLTLQLASANTTGSGVAGSGLEVSILPTQAPGGGPVIEANLGGVNTSNTASGAATTEATTVTTTAGTVPPVLTQAGGSPTSVHTGEWWAGSLPLIGVLAALGGGLIAWPRMREVPVVARLVTKVSR
ncbi:MAG: hypothetical protein KGJ77_02235 [Acidobacteriota bacterium]|nr:hypothetical protein [Acidobacteriota bacterium]